MQSKEMWSLIVICMALATFAINSVKSNLEIKTSCTCPGHEVVFECSATGGAATIWQGSALEKCDEGRILLRHSEFTNEDGYMSSKTCGSSGQITARAVSVSMSLFVSQLTIIATQQLNGTTVECTDDNTLVYGTRILSLTRDPFPRPTNLSLSDIGKGQLTFTWNQYSHNCPAIDYIITSTCGQCPNDTTTNFVVCKISSSKIPQKITLSVQTLVCDNIEGMVSKFDINLIEVPKKPNVMLMHTSDSSFILTTFNQTHDRITGLDVRTPSVIEYTVIYTDSTLNEVCFAVTISACACRFGVCSHVFDFSSSRCHNSTVINVTLYASNLLGDGPSSDPAILKIDILQTGINRCLNSSSQTSRLVIVLSSLLGALVTVIILIAFPITCCCVKSSVVARRKSISAIDKESQEQMQNEENQSKLIYEEINSIKKLPSDNIKTQENSAYGNPHVVISNV